MMTIKANMLHIIYVKSLDDEERNEILLSKILFTKETFPDWVNLLTFFTCGEASRSMDDNRSSSGEIL